MNKINESIGNNNFRLMLNNINKIIGNNHNNILLMNNLNSSLEKCGSILSSEKNQNIKICKMFLLFDCLVPEIMLDKRGDCTSGWRQNGQNGPPSYLKNFNPPIGWIAIGINVLDKYDNGDNTWLGTANIKGEWYIGYHGIRNKNAINGILRNGFIIGPRQNYEESYNNNILTQNSHMLCDKGAYFTPEIDEAKKYTGIIKYNEYNLRIVFMCRINPKKVRIAELGSNKEYWLTNGTTDEVRPYRILIKFDDNNIQ